MDDANVKAATVAAGLAEAAREARRANGDYGWLEDARTGERIREATEDEHARSCEAAIATLDPDPVILVDGRRVIVREL